MFNPRRRVPSEGALRVLRQLAYISSGTACGAAAVIAEERPRNTTLVSKIADNSRRLKQHSRYRHHSSHAASQHGRLDSSDAIVTTTTTTTTTPTTNNNNNNATTGSDQDSHVDAAFRNNVLPSEVERGYRTLSSRNHQEQTAQRPQPTNPQSWPQAHVLDTFNKVPEPQIQPFTVALVRTTLNHRGPASALAQLDSHCMNLVSQNRARHAYRQFSNCIDRLDIARRLPVDSLAAATRLLQSFLDLQLYRLCRDLLDWMHQKKEWIITECLYIFALSCATHLQHKSLIWLVENHGQGLTFPSSVYPVLCAAYSTHNVKVSALLFVQHVAESDRLSVLPLCEPAWPAILEQMWSTTGNRKLVDSLFNNMCQLSQLPSLELYNVMIMVCIKAGRVDKAHHYLRIIQQHPNMDPDIVTYGHFILLTASSSDWPVVDDLMAMLVRAGEADAPVQKRTELFIPVHRVYARQHSAEELWKFTFDAIDKYGIVPDQRILSTAIHAMVRTRNPRLIPLWLDRMKSLASQDHDLQIDAKTALTSMRQYYLDSRPSHVTLLWLCRRLIARVPEYWSKGVVDLLIEAVLFDIRNHRSHHPRSRAQAMLTLDALRNTDLDSRELPKPLYWNQERDFVDREQQKLSGRPIFDLSAESRDEHDAEQMEALSAWMDEYPDHHEPHQDFTEEDNLLLHDLPDTVLPREAAKKRSIEHEMLVALSTGQYAKVLSLYQESVGHSNLPDSSCNLEMAMQAYAKTTSSSSQEEQDFSDPPYITTAHEAGLETTAALIPLLANRIASSPPKTPTHSNELVHTTLSFYGKMSRHNMKIRHHLATATATILLRNNNPNNAITLLTTIYHQYQDTIPLDTPALTVLLQAYVAVTHVAGIEWLITEILSLNYRIDFTFMTVLRNASRKYREHVSQGGRLGMRALKLARRLEFLTKVCGQRQRDQVKDAARMGNQLVSVLTGGVKVKQQQEEEWSLSLLGRTTESDGGRQWRVVGARKKHDILRARKAERYFSATRKKQEQQQQKKSKGKYEK
jgi:pentatricopeptide repeat protein